MRLNPLESTLRNKKNKGAWLGCIFWCREPRVVNPGTRDEHRIHCSRHLDTLRFRVIQVSSMVPEDVPYPYDAYNMIHQNIGTRSGVKIRNEACPTVSNENRNLLNSTSAVPPPLLLAGSGHHRYPGYVHECIWDHVRSTELRLMGGWGNFGSDRWTP